MSKTKSSVNNVSKENAWEKNISKADAGKNNIVLIGMPASGKSTVGVILAKVLGMSFTDTDLIVQQRENALLSEIIAKEGTEGFLKKEENAILSIHPNNSVIATGGSAVYGEEAMKHLGRLGRIVYLKVSKKKLFLRLKNIKQRGVVLRNGESLEDMYEERSILYDRYADIVIEENNNTLEETLKVLIEALGENPSVTEN